MATRIQVRRDSAANWEDGTNTLSDGEFGLDTTNNILKIGPGDWADCVVVNEGTDLDDYPTNDEAVLKNITADQQMKGTLIVGDKIDGGTQNAVGLELSKTKGTLHIRPQDDNKSAIEVMHHGGVNKSRYKVMGDGTLKIGDNLIDDEDVRVQLNYDGTADFAGVTTHAGGISVTGGNPSNISDGLFKDDNLLGLNQIIPVHSLLDLTMQVYIIEGLLLVDQIKLTVQVRCMELMYALTAITVLIKTIMVLMLGTRIMVAELST